MPIQTRKDLSVWIKTKLGDPIINLEIADKQITDNIDDSIQRFTKYSGDASFRNALVLPLCANQQSYQLDSSVKTVLSLNVVQSATDGINILFSPMNQMYQQGFFDFLFKGDSGGSLVSYEMGMEYLQTAQDILGAKFFLDFNKYTHILKVTPIPYYDTIGVCEVYTKYDPGAGQSDIYNEIWVKEYALALSKINLGYIWGKYSGVSLPGGGTINAAQIIGDGLKEKEALENKLIKDEAEPLEFIIA